MVKLKLLVINEPRLLVLLNNFLYNISKIDVVNIIICYLIHYSKNWLHNFTTD